MWDSFFWGAVQGVTEFLPVSSSGHLFLLTRFFQTPEETFFLILAVHGATLLSILTVFRKNLKSLFILKKVTLFVKLKTVSVPLPFFVIKEIDLLLKMFVALVPLLFTGLFFKSFVVTGFQRQEVVSWGFLATGLFLLSLFFKKTVTDASLTFFKAFLIGLVQAVCVLPGFSRSGWTIGMGIFLGLSPQKAAFFSFLLALPTIAGALLVEGASQAYSGGGMAFNVLSGWIILAFITAYTSGLLALRFVLKLLDYKKLYLFGLYLIPLGSYLAFF